MNIINNDIGVPYFIINEEWYYYDDEEGMYKLTDKATKKAKESYEEFYKEDND